MSEPTYRRLIPQRTPPDPERFAAIEETLRRDQAAGRLRLAGPALCYWMLYATDADLRAWVLAQIDHHQASIGMIRCTNGWVASGLVDRGSEHTTGVRIRMDADGPTMVYAAIGDPSPGRPGDSWHLAVPPAADERDPSSPAPRDAWEDEA